MGRLENKIIPVKLKITNCYLIRGSNGFVMVDAGPPGSAGIFLKKLQKHSLDPKEITFIFVSHGHWDHWGSLQEIEEISRARSGINHREKEWVENGMVELPGGIGAWGKTVRTLMQIMRPLINKQLKGTSIGMALSDDEFSLEEFGIKGRLLHTPGHTDGSMSLLLDSGEAFVGDLAMSGPPRLSGPGPFVLGKDINTMKRSWQFLLDAGATKIYPSHGKPFNARVFDEYYKSRK